jgi:glycosyl hydrolase family 2
MPLSLPRAARHLVRLPAAERLVAWLAAPGHRRSLLLRRPAIARLALAGLTVALNGCVPATDAGTLPPTLAMVAVRGGQVAVQNGIPVPTFAFQPRGRLELDGPWRIERAVFDTDLSLTPRTASLSRIVADAGGREKPEFDDRGWASVAVPAELNPPPDRTETGGWYRRAFDVPGTWAGRTILLRFGAANYLADVWLNGVWLGYHEGGSTPFAFDATAAARPGENNFLAVRVDNPPWGTRNDTVPWGLADWWNAAGLTRPVWLEASDPVHAVRADVVPHLDGADVSLVLANSSKAQVDAQVRVEVLATRLTATNLMDADPRSLVEAVTPLATRELRPEPLRPQDVVRLDTTFLLGDVAQWSPLSPTLYVLRVSVLVGGFAVDTLLETFGLRQVSVDPNTPSILLNGQRISLPGVALHDQRLAIGADGSVSGSLPSPSGVRAQLGRAASVGARLIRTGHTPANPVVLELADRLGFAVWEEIPLYHYTPQTFEIAMRRGIPQQMLREMALRDMNHPSVLFHGLANESTGEEPRTRALQELHDIDRAVDGTRLTGQAAYGFNPADPTSAPLDVAGYTMYHGVFYETDAAGGTAAALATAHQTYPHKPIMALEFGRWADGPDGPAEQQRIFTETAPQLLDRRSTLAGGFVSAAVWWTLEDYATLRPNLDIEHFGLFDPDGTPRPVAGPAKVAFESVPLRLEVRTPGLPVPGAIAPDLRPTPSGPLLLAYIAYGLVFALAFLAMALVVMLGRGGRGRPMPGRADTPR